MLNRVILNKIDSFSQKNLPYDVLGNLRSLAKEMRGSGELNLTELLALAKKLFELKRWEYARTIYDIYPTHQLEKIIVIALDKAKKEANLGAVYDLRNIVEGVYEASVRDLYTEVLYGDEIVRTIRRLAKYIGKDPLRENNVAEALFKKYMNDYCRSVGDAGCCFETRLDNLVAIAPYRGGFLQSELDSLARFNIQLAKRVNRKKYWIDYRYCFEHAYHVLRRGHTTPVADEIAWAAWQNRWFNTANTSYYAFDMTLNRLLPFVTPQIFHRICDDCLKTNPQGDWLNWGGWKHVSCPKEVPRKIIAELSRTGRSIDAVRFSRNHKIVLTNEEMDSL